MKHDKNRKIRGRAFAAMLVIGLLIAGFKIVNPRIRMAKAVESGPDGVETTVTTVNSSDLDIQYSVEELTGGEDYNQMMSEIDDDPEADVQVLELKASLDGEEVSLEGCEVAVEASLLEMVADKGEIPSLMEVTIQPKGGEPETKLVTSGDLMSMSLDTTVASTFSVAEGESAVYAVKVSTPNYLTCENETPISNWIDVVPGTTFTLDLNGWDIKRTESTNWAAPLFYVHAGGHLIIKDSVGDGSITMGNGAEAIVSIIWAEWADEDAAYIGYDGIVTFDRSCAETTQFMNPGGRIVTTPSRVWNEHGLDRTDVHSVVNVDGGCLTGAGLWADGGAILAHKVNMTGGIITGNTANGARGGGIFAEEVVMTGGRVTANQATWHCENGSGAEGGGIYASKCFTFSGGEISENMAEKAGGGVYTANMYMSGGLISENTVPGNDNYWLNYPKVPTQGGGGIFIMSGPAIGSAYSEVDDTGDSMDNKVTAMLTGGTISNNATKRCGGGIFVDVDASLLVSGTDGTVLIDGNKAFDEGFVYGGGDKSTGHGFAGGGIFVEHPLFHSSTDKEGNPEPGRVYVYNAIITGNEAQYGGGIGGCGVSDVKVCSVDGAAVYGNRITPQTNNDEVTSSDDIYVDGRARVDTLMLGGVKASWVGYGKQKDGSLIKVEVNDGYTEFTGGEYLKATVNSAQADVIQSFASVRIMNNRSGSGGGGIGGNGKMVFGVYIPEPKDLFRVSVKKQVVTPNGNQDLERPFHFTAEFTYENGQLPDSIDIEVVTYDDEGKEISRTSDSISPKDGVCTFELMHNQAITFKDLPLGTSYKVWEDSTEGYEVPVIHSVVGTVLGDDGYSVTGLVGENAGVTYVNTAGFLLPNTGWETAKAADLGANACFAGGAVILAAGLLLFFKRRRAAR